MKRRPWTEEELAYLQEHWETLRDDVLATHLGRTIYTVRSKRAQLGLLGKPGKRQCDWTPEEEERLQGLWGEYTIPQIAKKMGRTSNAIIVKSKRLGLTRYIDNSEYVNARQTSDLLGIDVHTVTDVWPKYGLKLKKIKPRGDKAFKCVKMDDLIEWLRQNPSRWDSCRVDLYALGLEPDWLKEKRVADQKLPARRAQKWTPQEDAEAVRLFKTGKYTYAQIGERLGRSSEGVERRLGRLDVWGTGKFLAYDPSKIKVERKEKFERLALMRRLIELLMIRRNQLNFDGYWQKSICMKWDDAKGCTANETDCDSCLSFTRIKPQHCARCGISFLLRCKANFCPRCAEQRKKNAQHKWAIKHSRVS